MTTRLALILTAALLLPGWAHAQDAETRKALDELRAQNAELLRRLDAMEKRRSNHKIGVVDIGVLFQSYKRKDAFEEEVNRERKSMKDELKREHELIKEDRRRYERLPDAEKPLAEEKIKKALYDLELRKDRYQRELKKIVERDTLLILREIEVTIRDYGRKYKYTLIFKIDAGPKETPDEIGAFQERIFRAQISDLIYCDADAVEITKNVEKLLNSPSNLRRMERRAKIEQERRKDEKPAVPSKGF